MNLALNKVLCITESIFPLSSAPESICLIHRQPTEGKRTDLWKHIYVHNIVRDERTMVIIHCMVAVHFSHILFNNLLR